MMSFKIIGKQNQGAIIKTLSNLFNSLFIKSFII